MPVHSSVLGISWHQLSLSVGLDRTCRPFVPIGHRSGGERAASRARTVPDLGIGCSVELRTVRATRNAATRTHVQPPDTIGRPGRAQHRSNGRQR
jgi:hypothetical protein